MMYLRAREVRRDHHAQRARLQQKVPATAQDVAEGYPYCLRAEQAADQGVREPVLVAVGGPVPFGYQGAVHVVAGEGPDDVGGLLGGEILPQAPPFLQVGDQASPIAAAPG